MGFIASAIGAAQQSGAYDAMAGQYAKQGQTNQTLANMSASDALARGEQAAGTVQTRASQTIGAQAAGYAASGVDPSSGSPLQMMADTRVMSSYDQAILRNNAAREAFGYQVKGLDALQQGQLQAYGAQKQAQSARMQMAGDVAGGLVSTGLSFFNAGGLGGRGSTFL